MIRDTAGRANTPRANRPARAMGIEPHVASSPAMKVPCRHAGLRDSTIAKLGGVADRLAVRMAFRRAAAPFAPGGTRSPPATSMLAPLDSGSERSAGPSAIPICRRFSPGVRASSWVNPVWSWSEASDMAATTMRTPQARLCERSCPARCDRPCHSGPNSLGRHQNRPRHAGHQALGIQADPDSSLSSPGAPSSASHLSRNSRLAQKKAPGTNKHDHRLRSKR